MIERSPFSDYHGPDARDTAANAADRLLADLVDDLETANREAMELIASNAGRGSKGMILDDLSIRRARVVIRNLPAPDLATWIQRDPAAFMSLTILAGIFTLLDNRLPEER